MLLNHTCISGRAESRQPIATQSMASWQHGQLATPHFVDAKVSKPENFGLNVGQAKILALARSQGKIFVLSLEGLASAWNI